jgi:hypothetical protein
MSSTGEIILGEDLVRAQNPAKKVSEICKLLKSYKFHPAARPTRFLRCQQ